MLINVATSSFAATQVSEPRWRGKTHLKTNVIKTLPGLTGLVWKIKHGTEGDNTILYVSTSL